MPIYNAVYKERRIYELAYLQWIKANIPNAKIIGHKCVELVFKHYERNDDLLEEQRVREIFGL